jgi:hypothetical protein
MVYPFHDDGGDDDSVWFYDSSSDAGDDAGAAGNDSDGAVVTAGADDSGDGGGDEHDGAGDDDDDAWEGRWDVVYYCGATKVWNPLKEVGQLGGAEQAVLELSNAWATTATTSTDDADMHDGQQSHDRMDKSRKKKLRVAVFGNFSADPKAWPPHPHPSTDATSSTSGAAASATTSSSSPPSPSDTSSSSSLLSTSFALNEFGVEFYHVTTFDASRRFNGTLVLWRAFKGFFDLLRPKRAKVGGGDGWVDESVVVGSSGSRGC